MNNISWKNRIFPFAGALLVFMLCFSILYLGENVGLSDNGDFRRVLLANNLSYADDTDYYYLFKKDYKMTVEGDTFSEKAASVLETNKEQEIYTSPHFVIIKISKLLNLISNEMTGREETSYNIAWLAAIYIIMLTTAAWGIFTFVQDQKRSLKIAVMVLFLVMFCDCGYVLYFNSFYGEPLQYVALMMLISVGLMIYKRPSLPKVICFYISLYFFAGAKLANVPFSVIASLLAIVFTILRKDRLFKVGVVITAIVAVCCIAQLYSSIPDWMQQDTTYQSVFFGITKESDTPQKDLEELGVDSKYAVLANTHSYMDEDEYPLDIRTETFKQDFYDKVSKLDILFFYLRHPPRLIDKLNISIENSAYIRPPNSGNSSTKLMEVTNRYSMWSNLRVALKFLYQPIVIFVVFIVLTVYIILVDIFLISRRKKEEPQRLYMLCGINVLILGLWINLMLPILGNGEADISKHMFLFTNCIDILFAVLVIGLFNMKKKNVIISLTLVAVGTGAFYVSPPKKTMKFGTYNGRPVKWEIVEEYNDNTKLLMTTKSVAETTFDSESNHWETSHLRSWLNNEFLAEFTDEEVEKILPTVNEVILSYSERDQAVSGDHTHYWNFTRSQVDDLSKTAYHYYLEDYVYIPTLDMLKNADVSGAYWVLCPYANNDNMERYMKNDGFILHTNVRNVKGVRAVIKYDASKD